MKATLRLLRLDKRLSLKAVGALVGVSDNTVRRWEVGTYQPTVDEAARYADALGVSEQRMKQLLADAKAARQGSATPATDTDVTTVTRQHVGVQSTSARAAGGERP